MAICEKRKGSCFLQYESCVERGATAYAREKGRNHGQK